MFALRYWALPSVLMFAVGIGHAATPPLPADSDLIRERQERVLDEQRKRLEALQQAQQSPIPQWESRWGAIAADASKGILGVATNKSSEQQASQAALSDCASKGGGDACKIYTTYGNKCAAVVVGSGGFNTPSAGTTDEAVEIGMKTCRDAGSTGATPTTPPAACQCEFGRCHAPH